MIQHYYNRVPGFFSFKSVYDLALAEIPQGGTWVEIGSWQGRSLCYAVVESLQRGLDLRFHAVDIWCLHEKHRTEILQNDQDLYQAFVKNISAISSHVTVHRRCSWEAADEFQDLSVDFAMIDADHSYESVIKDIRAWWPKIRSGGRLVGDDLRKSFPGVHQAIREFARENQLPWSKQSGCWLMVKP